MTKYRQLTEKDIIKHVEFVAEFKFGIVFDSEMRSTWEFDPFKFKLNHSIDKYQDSPARYDFITLFKVRFGFYSEKYERALHTLTFYRANINYFFDPL